VNVAAHATLRKCGGEFARRTNTDAASNYSGCMDERCGAIERMHRSRPIRSTQMKHTTHG